MKVTQNYLIYELRWANLRPPVVVKKMRLILTAITDVRFIKYCLSVYANSLRTHDFGFCLCMAGFPDPASISVFKEGANTAKETAQVIKDSIAR